MCESVAIDAAFVKANGSLDSIVDLHISFSAVGATVW